MNGATLTVDGNKMKEYRTKLYTDVYSGIIPDRVPIGEGLSLEFLIQYAGKDLMSTQYDYRAEEIIEICEKGMEVIGGDDFGIAFVRNPVAFMLSKNFNMVMSRSGFIQHPEKSYMEVEDYDYFIQDPQAFIVEKFLPRINKNYQGSPIQTAVWYLRNFLATMDTNMEIAKANEYIQEKYGFFSFPMGSTSMSLVPFDEIADTYRGFRNITIDMKRNPQKLLDAMEALMPKSIYLQKPMMYDPIAPSMIMTHMGVFLNTKDFERFYWPKFHELCHIAAEKYKMHMFLFCEGNWMRFMDHLYDLPAGTRIFFEFGDPKVIKDRLGKKHVLGGLYPITYLKSHTRQQCIDKAKELLDVMAPGGNYVFSFDKQALSLDDIDPENYKAVCEFVREYGKYDNAGQKSSDFVFEETVYKYSHKYPEFKSKYDLPFEEFIKDYPVADERVLPIMKEKYEHYLSMAPTPFAGY